MNDGRATSYQSVGVDDEQAMVHMQNVLDIAKCDRLPEPQELKAIGNTAAETVRSQYGWEKLVDRLISAHQTVQVGSSEE